MTDTNFYDAEFERLSNNGRILDIDLSNTYNNLTSTITNDEKNARDNWNQNREHILDHYLDNEIREQITTGESLLQERLVPPKFRVNEPTGRNHEGRGETFADQIQPWDDFDTSVHEFILEGVIGGDRRTQREVQVFKNSLSDRTTCRRESDEELFLEINLFDVFVNAGIIGSIIQSANTDIILCQGRVEEENVRQRIQVECKSTQNLLLPMKADNYTNENGQEYQGVVTRYNDGIHDTDSKNGKYVCKPLAQLFLYMLQNRVRCGALTSATRTYFVLFEDNGDKICDNVKVSNAWFVGQHNYLRAWAYFYALSCQQFDYNDDRVEWNTLDQSYHPLPIVEESGDDSDSSDIGNTDGIDNSIASRTRSVTVTKGTQSKDGSKGNETHSTETIGLHSTFIPTISYDTIKFLNRIGHAGRNGGVFCAEWEGKTVAVKQFDISHPEVLRRFQKEKQAYEILQRAQGILIPKALFLAKSKAGVACLGMDMGYKSHYGEEETMKMLKEVIQDLKLKYGFYHQDVSRANCVVINDINNNKKLVAIDFEEYDLKPLKNERNDYCT